ncbi:hypothetical protein ACIRL2_40120 [Embleya sp. NPDC127516]|uniref:hypothetical protein n=1 Tax=Embleya sp. NPDC127516 TaxID=3363990 RepID=UPI00380E98D1
MSREGLEKVLHELGTSRAGRSSFAADAVGFLGRHRLSEAEAEAVRTRDVRVLLDAGVNPMLVWGFWLVSGLPPAEYLERLRRPSPDPAADEGDNTLRDDSERAEGRPWER